MKTLTFQQWFYIHNLFLEYLNKIILSPKTDYYRIMKAENHLMQQ